MMKLLIGQTVYHVVETFEPEPLHYRIAKCKVKTTPHGGLKEYCLAEKGHLYYCQRQYIYDTYAEAVKEAERETDEEEARWKRINAPRKLLRPWREKDGERSK